MDDYCRNFTIPENILVTLPFSKNCTWLKNIIRDNYTVEDVWRDALPANLYAPGGTYCYNIQYWGYFNSSENGVESSVPSVTPVIPWELIVPARLCIPQVCQSIGATGNPDMAGIGVRNPYSASRKYGWRITFHADASRISF